MDAKKIKEITALHTKCHKDHDVFLIEGGKLLTEYINSDFTVKAIYIEKGSHIQLSVNNSITVVEISAQELARISQLKTPNKLVAVVEKKINNINSIKQQEGWILALDDIQNPGNMGTIIRSADWFGIKHIVCSLQCVNCYNFKVVQATMGSLTRVKIYYVDLKQWIQNQLNNIPVFGAVLNGTSLYKTTFPNTGILLVGNEARGIAPDLLPYLTKITIPNRNSKADSLNVTMATAAILSEISRQLPL